jgi:hypothetical protein
MTPGDRIVDTDIPSPLPASRSRDWLAALIVGIAVRLLVLVLFRVFAGQFLFLDAQGYDSVGWKLATAWHNHQFPPVASVEFAGSLTYGYFTYVAIIYYVVGHHWIVIEITNALLSSIAIPLAASVGEALGGPGLRRPAAWLIALYPTAVFWSITGLKDSLLATLLLAIIALAIRGPSVRRMIVQALLLATTFFFRPALGLAALLIVVVGLARAGLRSRTVARVASNSRRFLLIVIGLPLVAVVTWLSVSRYLPLLRHSLSGEGASASGGLGSAFQLRPSPQTLARGLLGPFPWAFGPGTQSIYRALYPGMVLWIALLPAVFLGSWEVLRKGTWMSRAIILCTGGYLYLYFSVFESEGFFRQRFVVEPLLLVVASVAFARRAYWAEVWTAIGLVLISCGALLQAGLLPASVVLVLLVMTLGLAAWPKRSIRVRQTKRPAYLKAET